jgi:hypothetical protein
MAKPANMKRGSDANLFSISGASEALNRSRRTISHALQGVPADAIRHGLKLWTMKKIVAALNNTQVPVLETVRQGDQVLTGLAAQTVLAFEAYERAEDKMQGLKSVEARRRMARDEVAPLGREAIALMRDRDTESGLHPEHVQLRGDTIFRLMVRGLEYHCDWNSLQAWGVLDPGEDEDGEAA